MTEYEIYKYESDRSRIHEDQRVISDDFVFFNEKRFKNYLNAVMYDRKNLFEHLELEQIKELFGITKDGKPTLAGQLVFSDYPQLKEAEYLCITAVCYPSDDRYDMQGNEIRFLDNRKIVGSIPEMLESALDFVRKNTRNRTILDINGNRQDDSEYPIRAVREAVLNALIHRDYSKYTQSIPIEINIYKNKMEVISPGSLYGRTNVEALGKERPERRNTTLTSILENLKVSENRYSGIPTIRKESLKAGLEEPEFINTNKDFRVIFHSKTADSKVFEVTELDGLSDRELKVLRFCLQSHTRNEIADYLQLSYSYCSSKVIRPLIEKGHLISEKPKEVITSKSVADKLIAKQNSLQRETA